MRLVRTFIHPLFIILTAGLVGFAASISVHDVEMAGSGSATVKTPDVKITGVTWTLQTTDPSKVDKVKLTWENFIFPPFIEPSWYRFYVSAGDKTAKGTVKVKVPATVNDLLKVEGDVEYAKVISLNGGKPNKIELALDFPINPLCSAITKIALTVLNER